MNTCIFCQRPLTTKTSITFLFSLRKEQTSQLCSKCEEKFERINQKKYCPGCSRNQETAELCKECLKWAEEFPNLKLKHKAIFTYNETANAFMEQFKYQGDLLLAETFSNDIKMTLSSYKKSHILLTVPKSQQVLNRQGYNPVEVLLNRSGAKSYPLQDVESWIQEKKKKVILVDDVYKTGKTILQFRSVLEENFAEIEETMSFSLFR